MRLVLPTVGYLFFWRRFVKDVVVLISEMPIKYDPDVRPGQQPPLTPLGDAVALGDFLRFFERRLNAKPLVVSAQTREAFDEVKHRNLLVIGGPKYNFGALTLLIDLDDRLPYQYRRLRPREQTPYAADDPEMKRFVGRSPNVPAFATDPDAERDYGCVVMATNPYNRERSVLLVGGLSTLATLAATTWLNETGSRLWVRTRKTGFQAIVACRTSGITRVSNVEAAYVGDLQSEA